MNFLDLIIIIVIAASVLRGFQLGLIRQLVSLLGFFVAIIIAYQFSGVLAPHLANYIPVPAFDNQTLYRFSQTFDLQAMFYNAIAFAILFIGTKVILNIGGAILNQVASLPVLATINRTSGALVGLVQAVIIIILAIHIISIMPWPELKQYVENSSIANYLLNLIPAFTEFLYNLWDTSTIQDTIVDKV